MQSVNYFDERDKVNLGHAYGDLSQMQNALENKKKYFTCAIPTFREKPFFRILKELRQRFSYRRIDTEIYSQKWLQRLFIMILNGLWFVKNNNQPKSDYILVLLSSRYDPQLPIPSKIYLESTIEIIIDAFEIAKKEGMFKDTCLLIKEHPHDYSREILCSKWKTFFNSDIYWIDKRKDNVNLMNAARSIVVMNSSVGIEALMRRKSIVCLLPSIYNHKDIVINVSYPYRIDNLVNALIQSVSFKPDIVEVNSILSSILMRTQLSTLGYDDWKAGIKTEFNRRVTF
jgi:hypothetical protein